MIIKMKGIKGEWIGTKYKFVSKTFKELATY